MIQHILTFFIRLIKKDKGYYGASWIGLAISFSSFIFLMLFVYDELSYDRFHTFRDRIYRVTTFLKISDVSYHEATSQFPAAAAIKAEFPEVEEAVRIYPSTITLELNGEKFSEQTIFADSSFFNVFTFQPVSGNLTSSLDEPGNIVLTASAAKKYFGSEDAIGKTLLVSGQTIVVSAVIQDVPKQSHLSFTVVLPLSFQLNNWKRQTGTEGRENKWFWTGAYTYLLLKNANDADLLQTKLQKIVDNHFPEAYRKYGRFDLQSINDIHLKSSLSGELKPGGNILYVKLFSVVALVIILVSSINLINLSYFKINNRIREVGVRKFLGQNPLKIIAQLSMESVLTGIVSFSIALVLCQVFLSRFNTLVEKQLSLWSASGCWILAGSFVLILLVCMVAVLQPAIRYAKNSSGHLLLNEQRNTTTKSNVRNLLIGSQVCFSFIFLVFAFIIGGQISFFKNKDLGFDRDVIIINLNGDLFRNLEAFKNELRKNKDIVNITGAEVPGLGYGIYRFVPEGGSREKPIMLPMTSADFDFLKTLSINLLDGNNFSPDVKYDSLSPVLINKRAAVELGWQHDAIGRTLEVFAPGTTKIALKGKVIGLINDYHFESLHQPLKPVIITLSQFAGTILVKTSKGAHASALAHLQESWQKFSAKPFQYSLLNERLNQLYSNEDRLSNVITFFTLIALYLTCYGLFAMSAQLFISKLKEVAIRKVFGADKATIMKHFYARYAIFNLLAIIAGLPIAFYIGNSWLQNFQYRISLQVDDFLLAAGLILIAGLLSVSYYLFKMALSNPVKFLRTE